MKTITGAPLNSFVGESKLEKKNYMYSFECCVIAEERKLIILYCFCLFKGSKIQNKSDTLWYQTPCKRVIQIEASYLQLVLQSS